MKETDKIIKIFDKQKASIFLKGDLEVLNNNFVGRNNKTKNF